MYSVLVYFLISVSGVTPFHTCSSDSWLSNGHFPHPFEVLWILWRKPRPRHRATRSCEIRWNYAGSPETPSAQTPAGPVGETKRQTQIRLHYSLRPAVGSSGRRWRTRCPAAVFILRPGAGVWEPTQAKAVLLGPLERRKLWRTWTRKEQDGLRPCCSNIKGFLMELCLLTVCCWVRRALWLFGAFSLKTAAGSIFKILKPKQWVERC